MRHKHARENRRRRAKRRKNHARIHKETHCWYCNENCRKKELMEYIDDISGRIYTRLCSECAAVRDMCYFENTGMITGDILFYAVDSRKYWEKTNEERVNEPLPVFSEKQTARLMDIYDHICEMLLRFGQETWFKAGFGKKILDTDQSILCGTECPFDMVVFVNMGTDKHPEILLQNHGETQGAEGSSICFSAKPIDEGRRVELYLTEIHCTEQEALEFLEWAIDSTPELVPVAA